MWCWSFETYWDKSLINRLGKKPYSHRLSVSFHDFPALPILNQQLCTTRKPHYLSSYLQFNLPQNKQKVPQQAFNSLRRYNFLTIVDLFSFFPTVYCSILSLFSSLSMLNTFDKVGWPLGQGNSLTRQQLDYLCVQSLPTPPCKGHITGDR